MYKLTDSNYIIRIADGACIPFAEGNRDYQEYLKWLADGNTPQPAHTEEEIFATAKANKLNEVYNSFCAERDAITWVAQTDGTKYGYDRAPQDITNFLAAMKRAELGLETSFNVYVDNVGTKQFLPHTYDMFKVVLTQSANEQITAYNKFQAAKAKINDPSVTTIAQLEKITY